MVPPWSVFIINVGVVSVVVPMVDTSDNDGAADVIVKVETFSWVSLEFESVILIFLLI